MLFKLIFNTMRLFISCVDGAIGKALKAAAAAAARQGFEVFGSASAPADEVRLQLFFGAVYFTTSETGAQYAHTK